MMMGKSHSMRNRLAQIEQTAKKFALSEADGTLLAFDVAHRLYEALDTPLSLGCSILLKYGELEQLVGLKFDPRRYLERDMARAADDYQAISFLRKTPLKIEGVDREATAWKKFLQAEELCYQTNARIRHARTTNYKSVDRAVTGVILGAQRKISEVLGGFSAEAWARRCRFGPGSDDLNQGAHVSGYHKLRSGVSSTADFQDGARALVQCHPSWERALNGLHPDDHGPLKRTVEVGVAPGNKVVFVPKDALTFRSIAIEPQMNIYAQLGLGALLRSRLKRFGLDLDDQHPSRELALSGSLEGGIATIDLSMASDTLSRELVRELLPENWYGPLDWCRSKVGFYGDLKISYQKFSSMGNGFTFELESLIFWAIATATCDQLGIGAAESIRSFGDDIAVPTGAVPLLLEVLAFCGFEVNRRKSFYDGLFRESCGADFFNGINIRPFLLQKIPTNAQSLYKLANGLRRVAYRRNLGFGCDGQLRRVWSHVVRRLPKSLRDIVCPAVAPLHQKWEDAETGEQGLVVNFDEATASPFVRRSSGQMEGWAYTQWVPISLRERFSEEDPYYWVFMLYHGRDGIAEPALGVAPLRPRSARYRLQKEAIASHWLDLGPWV